MIGTINALAMIVFLALIGLLYIGVTFTSQGVIIGIAALVAAVCSTIIFLDNNRAR